MKKLSSRFIFQFMYLPHPPRQPLSSRLVPLILRIQKRGDEGIRQFRSDHATAERRIIHKPAMDRHE